MSKVIDFEEARNKQRLKCPHFAKYVGQIQQILGEQLGDLALETAWDCWEYNAPAADAANEIREWY